MRRRGDRVVWVNCAAGVAGDMLLGALVDAGADAAMVASTLAGLGVDGYVLHFEPVQRAGVRATHAVVTIEPDDEHPARAGDHHHDGPHGHHHHPHRPARVVFALLEAADLPERVRARALAAYRALAEVEGAIHGVDPDEVELHEVGATDAIVDVVGVCAALESLGADRVVCSPIAVGHGTVDAAHGRLPNPPPAVVRLLERVGAPAMGVDTAMELSTPTGVALVTTLADSFGPMPAMVVRGAGFGAGTADPSGRPNVVNVVVGTSTATRRHDATGITSAGRQAHLLEANLDDATGEVLAHTVARLLEAGAHDAWITPITMKKGRPGHTVHALCDDPVLAAVAEVLVREAGTLGLRGSVVERWPQRRDESNVEIEGHSIRVKVADHRVKVEHDDAAAVATSSGLPLRDVLRRAEDQARRDDTAPRPES